MTAGTRPYVWKSSDYRESDLTDPIMEFRLIYEGQLRASTNDSRRVQEKHDIRKKLHKQLAALWGLPPLDHFKNSPPTKIYLRNEQRVTTPVIEIIANDFNKCGYRFVPLVSRYMRLACSLSIQFYRRENPGGVLLGAGGGDLDNRLKTLLDALRVPGPCNELGGAVPEDGEDPFFCLLEDDTLVTGISIDTHWLLRPLQEGQDVNDVVLIIGVSLAGTEVTLDNLPLLT